MLTKCAFYCLTDFGLYSAILEKSGVAVFFICGKNGWTLESGRRIEDAGADGVSEEDE